MKNVHPRLGARRLRVGLTLALAAVTTGVLHGGVGATDESTVPVDSAAAASPDGSAAAPAAGDLSVALVSTQRAGDDGPVDDMVAALGRVEDELGAETTFIEATDPATYEQTLRNLGNAGTDIIVATFPGMQEPIAAVAGDFPDTKFVHIYGDPDETPIDNVQRISYEIYPGFYLGGMLAAAVSESGKIGYIGGVALPSLAANFHAYEAGAQSINPDIEVQGAWADSFEDPAVGLEIASSMFADGVDVIQTDAAATSNGVLEAAQDAGAFMIKDSDPTQFELAPDTIIAVSFLRFGQSLFDQVQAAVEPGWTGGTTVSGINEDITGLALNEGFADVGSADVVERYETILPDIETARQAIVDGELEVPFDTDTSFE